MPSLHQLTLSMNRLKELPDVSSWKSLLTLTADENSICAIPDGFTSLENLRQVDLTSNDIRVIPSEIARMDGLAMLRISGNPLRDKRFTSLTTEELKETLLTRLDPLPAHGRGLEGFGNGFDPAGSGLIATSQPSGNPEPAPPMDNLDHDDSRSDDDDFATPPTSAPVSPARSRSQTLTSQTWPVKTGGILDRANTESSSLHPVVCSKISAAQTIREIRLQHNTFTTLPNSLSFFADTLVTLSISHNQLVGESYLTEELDLTALKELNLSHNHITSIAPLTVHLRSPNLQKIDLSCNRIVTLPAMRDFFPSLEVLLVSNNHLEDLDPESVKGLKIIDASNNDIAHLNPRLGLLGGTGNLERLDVTGNRFRVPRWNVLDRGTDATLRWLRGRVPVAEMAEWKSKAENAPDDDASFTELD
jgi:Leucine-rich repeat (LRR) protein